MYNRCYEVIALGWGIHHCTRNAVENVTLSLLLGRRRLDHNQADQQAAHCHCCGEEQRRDGDGVGPLREVRLERVVGGNEGLHKKMGFVALIKNAGFSKVKLFGSNDTRKS